MSQGHPEIDDQDGLEKFSGLTWYYRRFFKRFSKYSASLQEVTTGKGHVESIEEM